MKSLVIDCVTGEESLIELSDEEIAKIEFEIAEAAKEINKEPTIAEKLASVGLSVDDLKAALGL